MTVLQDSITFLCVDRDVYFRTPTGTPTLRVIVADGFVAEAWFDHVDTPAEFYVGDNIYQFAYGINGAASYRQVLGRLDEAVRKLRACLASDHDDE